MSLAARLALLISLLAAGCGAKTGLDVPPVDGGPDAGIDGTVRDAGTDAEVVPITCVEVPLDGGEIEVPLDLAAQLARADVLFLVDVTASMQDEIDQIRVGLRDQIVPGIADAIPDAFLGVATLADFPEGMCGVPGDLPFRLVVPETDDVNQVQAAVDSLRLGNGLDRPEGQVEALYQVATGAGLGMYVPASFGCPSGGVGYPCFRVDALPVIVMFTDAPFHNGPGGTNPYHCTVSPPPHNYDQAVSALNQLNAMVIGMYSGDDGEGRPDMEQIARDTNALEDGSPLVFDIGGRAEQLSTNVVSAIRTLADTIEFDVDTYLVDPDPADGVDPRQFVDHVEPVRADPMDRIRGIDLSRNMFLGVRAGTRIYVKVVIRAGSIMQGPHAQRFRLEIVFRGDGRTRLGSRFIDLVVPGLDGSGCEGTTS